MVTNAIDVPDKQADIFWGEIAPCEHLVQIYEEDRIFLDALEGFVTGGIRAGDGVVVIAMPNHLRALEERVTGRGVDIEAARSRDEYIALDAEETLSKFMVNQWPDERLFDKLVSDLIKRSGRGGRRVRAFGEMVAMLWAQGSSGAVVHLEYLWHRFCREKAFCLFCAYPKAGFTSDDMESSMREICEAHTRVVAG